MNQQERRPLLLVLLAIPLRFQNPPLNLLLRTIKVKFLASVQLLILQLLLGEFCELADRKQVKSEVLGIFVPGIV